MNANNEHKHKSLFGPGESEVQFLEAWFVPDHPNENASSADMCSILSESFIDTDAGHEQNGSECRTYQHHLKKTKIPLSLEMEDARIILKIIMD